MPGGPPLVIPKYDLNDLNPALRGSPGYAGRYISTESERRGTKKAAAAKAAAAKKRGGRNRKNRKTAKRKWGFGMF